MENKIHKELLANKIVKKGIVNSLKASIKLPVYVLEYLISQYYDEDTPVEEVIAKVKDVLKLENREMQALMDDKILEKIDTILNDKKFDKITGKSKESIIENVNY